MVPLCAVSPVIDLAREFSITDHKPRKLIYFGHLKYALASTSSRAVLTTKVFEDVGVARYGQGLEQFMMHFFVVSLYGRMEMFHRTLHFRDADDFAHAVGEHLWDPPDYDVLGHRLLIALEDSLTTGDGRFKRVMAD
jgi:hypothetical protein